MTCRNCSGVSRVAGTAVPMPALLTRTSTRPNSLIAASTSAVHESGSATSVATARARRRRPRRGGRVREPVRTPGAEHDVGAGLGERLGERDAEPGGGPRHDATLPSSRNMSVTVMPEL